MDKSKCCITCIFWRDKGWDGDEGIGKCDNPIVIKQVTTMKEEHIMFFHPNKSEARMIAQSMRFHSNFGCIHHKPYNDETRQMQAM